MSLRRFILASAAMSVVSLFALAGVVRAEEKLWQDDFAAAKAKAKAEHKYILVDFTGSDWCPPCKKLSADVFGSAMFKSEAPKKFVLVELDYPRHKRQAAKLKKQNEELVAKYKIQAFPAILVMDAEGNVVAKTVGYDGSSAAKYVQRLIKFLDEHAEVVKITKELPKAKGLDRAKLLDKLIDDYVDLGTENEDIPGWDKEIVKLDVDNKAGLKAKHEYRIYLVDFTGLVADGKASEAKALAEKMLALPGLTAQQQLDVYLGLCQLYQATSQAAEAVAAADKAIAIPSLTSEQKQEAYFAKCVSYFVQGDFVAVIATAKKGQAVVPGSEQATRLASVIEKIQPMADAQQTVGKQKAELPKLKGIDRAKAIDKLVEAWDKLGGKSRDVSAAQVDKWSREVVTLDADGKAGLKVKYQFRNLLTDASKLERRPGDYRAAIEKALALPGLTAEQVQLGRFNMAVSYLKSNDLKNGFDQLQKAHDAAPKTERGVMIQQYLDRIKQQMGGKPKN